LGEMTISAVNKPNIVLYRTSCYNDGRMGRLLLKLDSEVSFPQRFWQEMNDVQGNCLSLNFANRLMLAV